MTVLGVDPGFDRCGWAVIKTEKTLATPLAFDCLQTNKKQEKLQRFLTIQRHFVEILANFPIDALAVESLYFSRNVSTALPVSEVRGLLFGLALERGIPIFEYAPPTVKLAVTGYGKADKTQMLKMITRLLKLEKIPKIDDTGDALAVALTHILQARPSGHL